MEKPKNLTSLVNAIHALTKEITSLKKGINCGLRDDDPRSCKIKKCLKCSLILQK